MRRPPPKLPPIRPARRTWTRPEDYLPPAPKLLPPPPRQAPAAPRRPVLIKAAVWLLLALLVALTVLYSAYR